jgi:hypothetical protein
MISSNAIVIRTATAQDARVLAELAQLDSAPALAGSVLIAEVDGVARAALELGSGRSRAVADPFAPTADLVALLRLRGQRLAAACAVPRRGLRARLAAVARRRPQRTQSARA